MHLQNYWIRMVNAMKGIEIKGKNLKKYIFNKNEMISWNDSASVEINASISVCVLIV